MVPKNDLLHSQHENLSNLQASNFAHGASEQKKRRK